MYFSRLGLIRAFTIIYGRKNEGVESMVIINGSDSKKDKLGFDFIIFFIGFLIGLGIGGPYIGLLLGAFFGFKGPKTCLGIRNSFLIIAAGVLIARYML